MVFFCKLLIDQKRKTDQESALMPPLSQLASTLFLAFISQSLSYIETNLGYFGLPTSDIVAIFFRLLIFITIQIRG